MENQELDNLVNSLNELIESITSISGFNEQAINKRSGYEHYPCITLEDLADIPRNIANKIKNRPYEFSDNILESIDYIIDRINESKTLLQNGLTNPNFNYFQSFVLTINWIDKYLYQSLEWESLPENTLPTTLRNRLRTQKRAVDFLEKSSTGLEEKVAKINSAYTAAKELPVIEDDLQEAIEKVRSTSKESEELYKENKNKSEAFSNQMALNKSKGEERLHEIENYKKKIEQLHSECNELKLKSAQAYSITNSNGLAGSFKERALALRKSSNYWIGGLILSLISLWWIGSRQVEKLQHLYTIQNINSTAIILQSITAILSITAPLWFAWLSTSQIHKLFKLSEDYGFKSSVSQSYEGYRKETAEISEELLKDLMSSLLRIMNEEPLRLVKDDTNATSPYADIINQILPKKDGSKNQNNKEINPKNNTTTPEPSKEIITENQNAEDETE